MQQQALSLPSLPGQAGRAYKGYHGYLIHTLLGTYTRKSLNWGPRRLPPPEQHVSRGYVLNLKAPKAPKKDPKNLKHKVPYRIETQDGFPSNREPRGYHVGLKP